MIGVFQEDPLAIVIALNAGPTSALPVLSYEDIDGIPHSVEARACLFHRARLMRSRPWLIHADRRLAVKWCQLLDAKIATGEFRSYRGSGQGLYFVYPPISLKQDPESSMILLDAVERNALPVAQVGRADLQLNASSGLRDFIVPCCKAEYVFIVCGHSISPGRFRRCIDSILNQDLQHWEAIIISDASDELTDQYIRLFCSSSHLQQRVTPMYLHWHRGQLANICTAVKHVCANPNSTIIVVDINDCLLGTSALKLVSSKYINDSADVTVGRALDMSKTERSDLEITFNNPRVCHGGGNVWCHLHTFKKYLFDRISDRDLRTSEVQLMLT